MTGSISRNSSADPSAHTTAPTTIPFDTGPSIRAPAVRACSLP
jgi:hypothetical protein